MPSESCLIGICSHPFLAVAISRVLKGDGAIATINPRCKRVSKSKESGIGGSDGICGAVAGMFVEE